MSWRQPPLPREAFSYRQDPRIPAFLDDKPIIVFDGYCALCSSFTQFVLRHDSSRIFRFLAAQTPLGAALYQHFGLDPVAQETIILLKDGRAHYKSDSAIRIFKRLGLPWSLAGAGAWLPEPLRDPVYELIARNRFNWFGRRTSCFLPNPAEADRFIA
jgi:predicted DCC family thiol-disulfide oxidoreductase YuxK